MRPTALRCSPVREGLAVAFACPRYRTGNLPPAAILWVKTKTLESVLSAQSAPVTVVHANVPGAAAGRPTGGRPRQPNTPVRLRRLLAVLLAAAALLFITATIVQRELQSVTQSARGTEFPAYLDAVQARASLSDADRAAWQSFGSGAAQLIGPGQQYQDDITTAGEALQRLGAFEAPDSPDSSLLQTISGQLVNYQGLVEQADAAYRRDVALGAASRQDLGFAYLSYASDAMRNRQGGLLAGVDQLVTADQRALGGQLGSPWANPALLLPFAVCAVVAMAGIGAAQLFLQRRFRRMVSLPLLLAAAAVCGLSAWLVIAAWNADSAFAAARGTALPSLTAVWQAQTKAVDTEAAALRAGTAPGGSAASSGGLNPTETQRATSAVDADLASAAGAGGLPIGIPVLAVAIAVLGFLGLRPRLNEYRG
jgi:hypothetical protein